MRYLRSIVQDRIAVAAAGVTTEVDLPTNPLSHLVLTVSLERPDESATAAHRVISDSFGLFSDVHVAHDGEQIIQGSLADLAMMAAVVTGYTPHGAFLAGTGQEHMVSFILPFSRKLYWPEEAYPATTRGRFKFRQTVLDATPGSATAAFWQLEAVELIEAQPTRHLKYTTLTRALTATGRQRVPLPLEGKMIGCLLFNPATEITATEESAFGKVKLMVDNVEQYYQESNWESLRADVGYRVPGILSAFGHVHSQLAADTITGQERLSLNQPPAQYGYLDLDPNKDGEWGLETDGLSDVELDLNSDVSTGTLRYLPLTLRPPRGR